MLLFTVANTLVKDLFNVSLCVYLCIVWLYICIYVYKLDKCIYRCMYIICIYISDVYVY